MTDANRTVRSSPGGHGTQHLPRQSHQRRPLHHEQTVAYTALEAPTARAEVSGVATVADGYADKEVVAVPDGAIEGG